GGTYAPCPLPTVTLTAPSSGATVSGMVTLTAMASASATYGLTITQVEFMVDGTSVGMAMTSPYTVAWNSTMTANGNHSLTATATDSVNGTATTPAITITVQNPAAAAAVMEPSQIFPAPRSSASGRAQIAVRADSGALSGAVTLQGFSANAVTINEGFAGSSGAALIALTPRAGNAGEWQVPARTLLTEEQLTALMQGRLYVMATSAAHPDGEVRGQLVSGNIKVMFSRLTLTPEAAALGMTAQGVAATTLDTASGTLTIHVNSTGADDAMAAQAGTAGVTLALVKDSVAMGHWSAELAHIGASEVAGVEAGRWSVSVATPTAADGALQGTIRADLPARAE
ncbi:MAG: CHRD domain-containing protein, partial [Steroidobacteraceae bacterium]